ncbi:hypothetical protein GVO57_11090 [Sphingomonas changnyeongensis]|uniref:Uncharacterized protein n=1 Tax=Sphingomonas changnyeongensis TaxID=2698679 RepID=A0A7Z2NXI6_9SPHN|nr:hypothetical protein [Sphingomonas changnyeongensis]QHL91256.1 hypothetical protein GVO57_11090 [Sphingomonas changnyeongensis]
MSYAETTKVPFDNSIAEIVGIVRKCGGTQIVQADLGDHFVLQFTLTGRMIRFRVAFPTDAQIAEMIGPRQDPVRFAEQWRRQRGRALLLVIKAKFESVVSNVETVEEAFLANVVMSDGQTLYDRVREPIALEYQSGAPSPLLISGPPSGGRA